MTTREAAASVALDETQTFRPFTVVGIDPGGSGGVAWQTGGIVEARKFDGQTESDVAELLRWMTTTHSFAVIEAVHSMPKQGVASSFKFGRSYGFLRGLLIGLNIPFEEVSPQKWQKAMACQSGGDKNVTKARAQQLWPHLKIIHATADALLLCEFARRLLVERGQLTPLEDG